jgi:V/A-type H+-transporting ATPase subunit E
LTSNLEKLAEEIIADGRAKAEEIRKRGQHETEERISRERTAAAREAEGIVRSAVAEAEAAKNRLVSQATQKARVAYLAERNRILHELFGELREELEQFAENDVAYRGFLTDSVARGASALPAETVKVLVSERDLKRYRHTRLLEEALQKTRTVKQASFSDEPVSKMGGAVVTSEDGKVRADCTIDARLELMQPQILAEISKVLFSVD